MTRPPGAKACICLTLAVAGVLATTAAAAQRASLPLRLTHMETVGRGLSLGDVMGTALAPDGSVYIADRTTNQVYRLNPDGSIVDTIGASGAGPGEFGMVYRIGVRRATGELLVYDVVRGEVSTFNDAGKYVSRTRLPISFAQLDAIVPLDDGSVAISGTISRPLADQAFGVHVFDRSWQLVRSFGPLPVSKNPRAGAMWGAGLLTLTAAGDLLYVRRLPYEIYRYSATGTLLGVTNTRIAAQYGPDDAIAVTTANGRVTYSTGRDVWRPVAAVQLPDGSLLSGRFDRSGLVMDRFKPDGTRIGTGSQHGVTKLIGIDVVHRLAWFVAEDDSAPVIKRAEWAE